MNNPRKSGPESGPEFRDMRSFMVQEAGFQIDDIFTPEVQAAVNKAMDRAFDASLVTVAISRQMDDNLSDLDSPRQ